VEVRVLSSAYRSGVHAPTAGGCAAAARGTTMPVTCRPLRRRPAWRQRWWRCRSAGAAVTTAARAACRWRSGPRTWPNRRSRSTCEVCELTSASRCTRAGRRPTGIRGCRARPCPPARPERSGYAAGGRARALGDAARRAGVQEPVLRSARWRFESGGGHPERVRPDGRPRDAGPAHRAGLRARAGADRATGRRRRLPLRAARRDAPPGCSGVRRLGRRQLIEGGGRDARRPRLPHPRAGVLRCPRPAGAARRHPTGVLRPRRALAASGPARRRHPDRRAGHLPRRRAGAVLASTFPHLIHGAIGLVPSATVSPAPAAGLHAWTRHGRAVPFEDIPVERIQRARAHRRRRPDLRACRALHRHRPALPAQHARRLRRLR
jgi:hypothetical protein